MGLDEIGTNFGGDPGDMVCRRIDHDGHRPGTAARLVGEAARGFDLDMARARPMKDESDVIGAGGNAAAIVSDVDSPQIFTSVDIGVSLSGAIMRHDGADDPRVPCHSV